MSDISEDRCWICGLRMPQIYKSRNYIPYICFWCAPNKIKKNFGGEDKYLTYELICDLIEDAENTFKEDKNNLVRCESIFSLSLLADIGEFGSVHPYTKQFTKIIATILMEVGRSRSYGINSLIRVSQGFTLEEKYKRIISCLSFMVDVGLLGINEKARFIQERFYPSELLINVSPIVEADSNVKSGLPSRIADCLFGYAFLKGIKLTVEWLADGAKGEPKGFIKIYPIDPDGRKIPISFTAPLSYLLGALTSRENFSQGDICAWLQERGISGRNAYTILSWLNRTISAHHRLVDPKRDPYGLRFIFNSEYIRLRERFRERWRSR